MNTDPVTGAVLPPTAIQRVLFVGPKVHVYQIPPLTSTKGYVAASWTEDNNKRCIFTARLRIMEIAVPYEGRKSIASPITASRSPIRGPASGRASPSPAQRGGPVPNSRQPATPLSPTGPPTPISTDIEGATEGEGETVSIALLLEEPSNGSLFAAAPYNQASAVAQAVDSSRFFAIRVVDPSGRKAMLGIGFEERSEAFDFSVTLQDARKTLRMDDDAVNGSGGGGPAGGAAAGRGGASAGRGGISSGTRQKEEQEAKRDFRLKEGETITVKIGGRGSPGSTAKPSSTSIDDSKALFSIPPPPSSSTASSLSYPPPSNSSFSSSSSSGGSASFLPPPPSARDVKAERRRSRQNPLMAAPLPVERKENTVEVAGLNRSMKELGFDDGEFGEFQ